MKNFMKHQAIVDYLIAPPNNCSLHGAKAVIEFFKSWVRQSIFERGYDQEEIERIWELFFSGLSKEYLRAIDY